MAKDQYGERNVKDTIPDMAAEVGIRGRMPTTYNDVGTEHCSVLHCSVLHRSVFTRLQ